MKIGICSPFMPHELADLLSEESRSKLREFKGVTATPVTPLAREMHAMGHSISVFCLDPSALNHLRLYGERLSIHVLPKRRFRQCALDCYRQERRLLCDAIATERPDKISAHWSYEHALGALDSGVPTLVTCHDTPLRYAWIAKSFFMLYHVFVAASVFRRAKHLVAVSPYTAAHISKFFFPKAKPIVLPNGLPEEIFLKGRQRLNESPPRHGSIFTICSVGGWGRIKNITTLLKAYSIIRDKHRNVRLVLFGGALGTDEAAHQWASKRNLARGVEFLGKASRSQILAFLRNEADLMIHASLVECHPMVLIEAVASGVPVIGGTNSGGVAWTLGHGKYGTLCDVKDPASIAAAAQSVIYPSDSSSTNPSDAWEGIHQECSILRIASETVQLLIKIRE